jgi:hypothetical protein
VSDFEDMLKADMAAVFCNPKEFGETFVYKPKRGSSRTVNGLVDRNPPAYHDESGKLVQPSLSIGVPNDVSTGISSAELDVGGDKINIAMRIGGVARDYLVHLPKSGVTHDAGELRLVVL